MFRALRVALLSTGDEVRDPGAPLPPGAIYDANRFMLSALLAGMGCLVTDLGIRPDREAALADTLAAACAEHDLIVTSGGVSTGEEDHVKAAIERLGSLHFWRLAIKPGRPVALGQIGGVPLIGLPGNPVAVIVTFVVLAPAADPASSAAVPRAAPALSSPSRFWLPQEAGPARISAGEPDSATATTVVAAKYPKDGAGILSSIVQSEGLVVLDEATSELQAGATVDFLPFSGVDRVKLLLFRLAAGTHRLRRGGGRFAARGP